MNKTLAFLFAAIILVGCKDDAPTTERNTQAAPQLIEGPAGAPGVKGDKGNAGIDGATGAQGIQGIQGLQGIAGTNGANGLQGLQGVKGDKGDKGDQGATGQQGSIGIPGISVSKIWKSEHLLALPNLGIVSVQEDAPVICNRVSNISSCGNACLSPPLYYNDYAVGITLDSIEVVIFSDGSSSVTVYAPSGLGSSQSFHFWLKASGSVQERVYALPQASLLCFKKAQVRFRVNTSTATPTFVASVDYDGDFSNNADTSFPLTEIP